MTNPDWATMDARPRRRVGSLTDKADIPTSPGVYAFYLGDERKYVGKATGLQSRVWGNHLRKGGSMTSSALRRNVAEHLGIAPANDIKTRRYTPRTDEVLRVNAFTSDLDVAWIECKSVPAAEKLESDLKRQYLPPLTKR